MQLKELNREQNKYYRDYLKQAISKSSEQKKLQNSYQWRVQQLNQNQMINKLNHADQIRLRRRRDTAQLLKQQNSGMGTLKKNIPSINSANLSYKKPSFTDRIHNMDEHRIKQQKYQLHQQSLQNSQQDQVRRYFGEKDKERNRSQQYNHMRRIKQMQDQSQRNYKQIKKKHQQDMGLYQIYKDKAQQNQELQKQIKKFTDTQRGVINPLYRNEREQRKQNNLDVQQILKKQIQEFDQRKVREKQEITYNYDLQKSLFKDILHHDSYDRKKYADYLKTQIEQQSFKRNHDKLSIKQKIQVPGVVGGQHSHQRKNQIKYINRKLGFGDKIEIISNNKSQFLPKSVQKEQKNINNSNINSSLSLMNTGRNLGQKTQKQSRYSHNQFKPQSKEPSPYKQTQKDQNDIKKIQEKFDQYFIQKKPDSTLNKLIEKSQPKQMQLQAISLDFKSIQPKNKRYLKSYDLVLGKNKLYEVPC